MNVFPFGLSRFPFCSTTCRFFADWRSFSRSASYEADLLNDLQSAKNRHVVEQNGNLESPNGNTFIADGADYVLSFFGITRYSLTDVMVGTTNESFIDDDHSNILQLAEAISRGSGVKEALVLAAKLIGLPQPSQIRTT